MGHFTFALMASAMLLACCATVPASASRVAKQLLQTSITVFTECNYGGSAYPIPPGSYNFQQFTQVLGIPNDQISSIMVPIGFSVTLFRDDLGSASTTLGSLTSRSDVACLSSIGFDNVVSSLTVSMTNAAASVVLYQDCNYVGPSWTIPAGTYTTAGLTGLGVPNNGISSIKVPAGVSAHLFADDIGSIGGVTLGSTSARSDVACLSSLGFDDALSSLVVAAGAPGVLLYTDCNYGGPGWSIPPGTYSTSALTGLGVFDNAVSSIIVPAGLSTDLWTDNLIGSGRAITTTTDRKAVPCLEAWNWDDVLSSMTVSGQIVGVAAPTASPPPSPPPAVASASPSDQVVLYESCNYGGRSWTIPRGTYSFAALMALGVPNDAISSLTVPAGLSVHLFLDDLGSSGTSFGSATARTDVACLSSYNLDNGMSSMVVSVGAPTVILYEDCDFKGRSWTIPVGRYPFASLTGAPPSGLGVPNDAISSMLIPAGVSARMFADELDGTTGSRYTEGSATTRRDIKCLSSSPYNFDNKLSSLEVVKL